MRSIATGSANPAGASASRSQAHCQMPNHVHLILTPQDGEGLALALSRAHRLYAGFVNARAARPAICFRAGSARLGEAPRANARARQGGRRPRQESGPAEANKVKTGVSP